MIRLLFENQISNCFITLFSLSYTASIFLSIISILMSPTKRINFASWTFKGKSFLYNKNKRGPELIPKGQHVLFPYTKIYISVGFSLLLVLNISTSCKQ
jgi:hypothetical protein